MADPAPTIDAQSTSSATLSAEQRRKISILATIRDRMIERTRSLATPFSHGVSLEHYIAEATASMWSRPGGPERILAVGDGLVKNNERPDVAVAEQFNAGDHHAFRNSLGAKAGAPGREVGELIDEILVRERQAVIDSDIKNFNDDYTRSVALVMENGE